MRQVYVTYNPATNTDKDVNKPKNVVSCLEISSGKKIGMNFFGDDADLMLRVFKQATFANLTSKDETISIIINERTEEDVYRLQRIEEELREEKENANKMKEEA